MTTVCLLQSAAPVEELERTAGRVNAWKYTHFIDGHTYTGPRSFRSLDMAPRRFFPPKHGHHYALAIGWNSHAAPCISAWDRKAIDGRGSPKQLPSPSLTFASSAAYSSPSGLATVASLACRVSVDKCLHLPFCNPCQIESTILNASGYSQLCREVPLRGHIPSNQPRSCE